MLPAARLDPWLEHSGSRRAAVRLGQGHRSFREGGTLIEYEDEDPQVRADFEAALAKNGLKSTMPAVTYSD